MKSIKHVKFSVLCLAGLCMMATFAFGATGSASAKVLLFKATTAFPYHLTGKSAAGTKLETVGGSSVTSTAVDALALILSATLFDARLTFLGSSTAILGSCQTPGDAAGTILINLLGHLGLTHPSDLPGVLLLIPSGFSFECGGVIIDVRGSVIGLITKPAILTAGNSELGLSFEQAKGIQNHTAFLFGGELLTNQFLESNILGVTNKFEKSGQEAAVNLKATGTGTFEIADE